jgi:hypothetical protein
VRYAKKRVLRHSWTVSAVRHLSAEGENASISPHDACSTEIAHAHANSLALIDFAIIVRGATLFPIFTFTPVWSIIKAVLKLLGEYHKMRLQ